MAQIPVVGSSPVYFTDRISYYYYLVNTSKGLLALDAYCPFGVTKPVLWINQRDLFDCPICGSRFTIEGNYLEGLAKRGMNRLVLEAYTPSGLVTTPEDGSPVLIDGADSITVNTWKRILRARHI